MRHFPSCTHHGRHRRPPCPPGQLPRSRSTAGFGMADTLGHTPQSPCNHFLGQSVRTAEWPTPRGRWLAKPQKQHTVVGGCSCPGHYCRASHYSHATQAPLMSASTSHARGRPLQTDPTGPLSAWGGAPEGYVYGANQRSDIKFFFLVSLPLKRGTTLLPMRDT